MDSRLRGNDEFLTMEVKRRLQQGFMDSRLRGNDGRFPVNRDSVSDSSETHYQKSIRFL
jgi:hypothetical protein